MLSVDGSVSTFHYYADVFKRVADGEAEWIDKRYRLAQLIPKSMQPRKIAIPWETIQSGRYGPTVLQMITGQPVYANESVREARG